MQYFHIFFRRIGIFSNNTKALPAHLQKSLLTHKRGYLVFQMRQMNLSFRLQGHCAHNSIHALSKFGLKSVTFPSGLRRKIFYLPIFLQERYFIFSIQTKASASHMNIHKSICVFLELIFKHALSALQSSHLY